MKSKLLGLLAAALGCITGGMALTAADKRGYQEDGLYGAPPTNPKTVIPKGHKQFFINGEEIWALNHKNALKKYQKNFF
jgi:hypothetical protein